MHRRRRRYTRLIHKIYSLADYFSIDSTPVWIRCQVYDNCQVNWLLAMFSFFVSVFSQCILRIIRITFFGDTWSEVKYEFFLNIITSFWGGLPSIKSLEKLKSHIVRLIRTLLYFFAIHFSKWIDYIVNSPKVK